MNTKELREKVISPEFQYKLWRVLADILEDRYNTKINILGFKDKKELADTSSSK